MDRNSRIVTGAHGQEAFEGLLEEMANTRAEKVLQYGADLQLIDNWPEASLMGYANIGRKWRRLKRLMWGVVFEEKRELNLEEKKGLREALLDMASYCLYAVQMMDKLSPVPATKPGARFPVDQVAIYAPHPEKLISLLRDLGCDEWFHDRVSAHGEVFERKSGNVADLAFNYQLIPGVEFEVLSYREGGNWIEAIGAERTNGLSHLGVHVEDLDGAVRFMEAQGYKIAQQVTTQSHTNPHIANSRRYEYVIFDSRDQIGFDLKLIKRLPL